MNEKDDNGSCELAQELDLYALGELSPARMETVRSHIEGCSTCRAEAAAWRQFVVSADHLRSNLEHQLEPLDQATASLMAALDGASSVESPPDAGARTRSDTTRATAGMWLAAACLLALSLVAVIWVAVPIAWHLLDDAANEAGAGTPGIERRHGWIELTEADSGRNLDEVTLWRSKPERDLRLRLGGSVLTIGARSEVRGSGGMPPRVDLEVGKLVVETEKDGTVIVRFGEVELRGNGRLSVEDVAEGNADERRVRIEIDGGATLSFPQGLAEADRGVVPIELVPNEPTFVRLDATTGAATGLELPGQAPLEIPPSLLAGGPSLEDPSTSSDPASGDLESTNEGLATAVNPVDDEERTPTQPRIPGVQLRELPEGTVEVELPDDTFVIGETFFVSVNVGSGEGGLGAYQLEVDFQAVGSPGGGGDLRVMLVDPRRDLPSTHSWLPEEQTLRVLDYTSTQAALGRNTFNLLRFEVRLLEGSPGSHAVGGRVQQLVSPDERSLGRPVLQVRGSVKVRNP